MLVARYKATRTAFFSSPFCLFWGWCGSWVLVFGRPRLERFCAAWTEISSPTTDLTAPLDIPELVSGKVCGTPHLNHTGMRKLRSLGQYTGIGYTYRGDGVWRMAYEHKCVTFSSHVQKATGR